MLDLDRSTVSSLDKVAETLASFSFLDNNGKSNVLFDKSFFSQIPSESIKPTNSFFARLTSKRWLLLFSRVSDSIDSRKRKNESFSLRLCELFKFHISSNKVANF